MRMTASVRIGIVLIACWMFSACTGSSGSGHPGDCASYYESVANAPSWEALRDAMLRYGEWGRVVSVRTQVRGEDVGAGNKDAVRVVDLVNRNGRRLIQVDVWRTDAGAWRAGVWNQCID
jgi:hypothetical protein